MATALPYPTELAHDVRLPGGAQLHIRPIRAADEPELLALFLRLSTRSRYQRFFSPIQRLPASWLHRFVNVDYRERLALVAEHVSGAAPELVGVARYEPEGMPDEREIAVVIDDRWQARGLGTILVDELLRAADARGVTKFRAFVLADNVRMLAVLARLGTVIARSTEEGVVDLLFTRAERASVQALPGSFSWSPIFPRPRVAPSRSQWCGDEGCVVSSELRREENTHNTPLSIENRHRRDRVAS
jgi:RimJ/RimL family protein N-acetyltransferase